MKRRISVLLSVVGMAIILSGCFVRPYHENGGQYGGSNGYEHNNDGYNNNGGYNGGNGGPHNGY